MRFEHVNLRVADIDQSLRFYRAALPHWQIRGGGSGTSDGEPWRWIHFGDEHCYIAFFDGGTLANRNPDDDTVGLAHFAFETLDLDGLIARLAQAGFKPSNPGADDPHRRNIYFVDNDGFEVEFVQYSSDDPKQRNRYANNTNQSPTLLLTGPAPALALPRFPW